MRKGSIQDFLKKAKVEDSGCWSFPTKVHPEGYYYYMICGERFACHRLMFEIEYGPVPDGMFVSHTCPNRGCINPEHLKLATNGDVRPHHTEQGLWARIRIDLNTGCWLFEGPKDGNGYGCIMWEGKRQSVHRIMFRLANGGELPDSLDVLHHCDNPPCCNPTHLFSGTSRENSVDAAKKGRAGRPKLNMSDVREIRRQAAIGVVDEAIAHHFGVSRQQVNRIRNRQSRIYVT